MASSFWPQVGDVVTVHPVPDGYPLPEGLPAGAQVRVIRWEDAYATVKRDGREWRVYLANMERSANSTRAAGRRMPPIHYVTPCPGDIDS
jgi:hypothetical protein